MQFYWLVRRCTPSHLEKNVRIFHDGENDGGGRGCYSNRKNFHPAFLLFVPFALTQTSLAHIAARKIFPQHFLCTFFVDEDFLRTLSLTNALTSVGGWKKSVHWKDISVCATHSQDRNFLLLKSRCIFYTLKRAFPAPRLSLFHFILDVIQHLKLFSTWWFCSGLVVQFGWISTVKK